MKVLGVIPARMGASRFPGKPLAHIMGRPMINWVIEGARTSQLIDEILVATDDIQIAHTVESLGIKVEMTESDLPSGTDRIWAAIKNHSADIVVNIQGDEPLINGAVLDPLIQSLLDNVDVSMTTAAAPLAQGEEVESRDLVKVLIDQYSNAIYFSRFALPYSRLPKGSIEVPSVLKHIGIYAYRRDFLGQFCQTAPVAIELAEGLEQLRALYLGVKIRIVPTDQTCCGVDTPEDVKKIERLLKGR